MYGYKYMWMHGGRESFSVIPKKRMKCCLNYINYMDIREFKPVTYIPLKSALFITKYQSLRLNAIGCCSANAAGMHFSRI